MNPRPDHGEDSYKGSGRLVGRKTLITGGDSGMGRAAAIAYAREGADIAISYYPTEEPDAREVIDLIKKEGRKAIPIPGDLREERYCKELVAKALQALGGLDVVVCNAGRQQQCEDILKLTSEAFDATMKRTFMLHFGSSKLLYLTSNPDPALLARRRSRHMILQPICTTMRRRRRRR
jgi:NAD(P)-dependent dehydrogenase (short-subunit alcohol dehydrogenase family)